ncbi:acetyl-CoA synthetase-like protein [Thozetella sp. PMI_491]|nr:acetyl-CoA synthetase-like protein [Thozetella sp. PMI_491]
MEKRAPHDGLSLVRGTTDPPLIELTLGQLVDRQAQLYSDREAVIVGWTQARITYRDMAKRTKELAKGLLAIGIRKDDRVAIFSGDDERFVELFFAIGRIGACLVILNKTYTVPECLRALEHAAPRMLFVPDEVNRQSTLPLLQRLRQKRHGLEHVVLLRPEQLHCQTDMTWNDILSAAVSIGSSVLDEAEMSVDTRSIVNLQFTSGTTGSPKAAMLSHHNITNNGFFIGKRLGVTTEDILCCGPPLFHCFGLVAGLLATFTHGACIGFAGRDFDAALVANMLQRERCTAFHGVPTMFTSIFRHMELTDIEINTVKKGIIAGSKVAPTLAIEAKKRLGYEFLAIAYGMTETSPMSFMTESCDTQERKLETVGRAMPHVLAKVVDKNGKILPVGTRGEICISGYLLQQGYFRAREKTEEAMVPDDKGVLWMHTGDEATIDEAGYVRITGRVKDIIIRGGENIYPPEIEERLLQHPAISHASVVGVTDDQYGEAVTAFLEVRPGQQKPYQDDVVAWVREELGRHKAPKHIIWVGKGEAVEDYPITGSGKIRKDLLREMGNRLTSRPKWASRAKI